MTSPEVIAHRGTPREIPENTLPGFRRALELGVQGIELDVHGTGDGVVVVNHDPSIAQPGAGLRARISNLTLSELRAMRTGLAAIPTLREVLDMVDGKAQLYVEVKAAGIEEAVVELLRPMLSWCAVHSFDHRIVARVRGLEPRMRLGVLSASYPVDPVSPMRDAGALDLWQQWDLIDEILLERVHAIGGRVIAWTVNDVYSARHLVDRGTDGLCTDVADELLQLIPPLTT